ncbi:MAG TPA: GNAT family N-acetyltransferase [Candidatus Paceibacterota bacterium]|nr:GNAT family N-acetyltransferase [Candidatus Paceibacterota bacterium]
MTTASKNALQEINKLLPQLRRDPGEPLGTQTDLDAILENKNVIFVVAKDDGKVIGMCTVYLATKFGKRTGFVEDVVVDEGYRGQKLGQKMMEIAIQEAKQAGASQLYLTSGNDRIAAQHLYEKVGFKKRDTQVFRLQF